MHTYPLTDKTGLVHAFEVENVYVSKKSAAEILRLVPAVSEVRARRPFSVSSDIHIEFQFNGQEFVVCEPFGDNSRFWIGPTDELCAHVDVTLLEDAFKGYRPPLVRKLIGDLLTLKFLTIFRRKVRIRQ